MELKSFANALEAELAIAADLSFLLEEYAAKNKPVLLALSGGSSLGFLDGVTNKSFGSHLTIMPIDERYDPTGKESNFEKLVESDFFARARSAGADAIDTRAQENETQEGLKCRWLRELTAWLKKNPTGSVVATLGMGPDGHIAGIMPFPENPELFSKLFESEEMLVAYDASGKNPIPLRITTTLSFMRRITRAFGYITGDNKKSALQKALQAGENIAEIPAKILLQIPGNIYTDITIAT